MAQVTPLRVMLVKVKARATLAISNSSTVGFGSPMFVRRPVASASQREPGVAAGNGVGLVIRVVVRARTLDRAEVFFRVRRWRERTGDSLARTLPLDFGRAGAVATGALRCPGPTGSGAPLPR